MSPTKLTPRQSVNTTATFPVATEDQGPSVEQTRGHSESCPICHDRGYRFAGYDVGYVKCLCGICDFCKGQPVGNAASWLDGKPRPPAACPRCGETNYPKDSK